MVLYQCDCGFGQTNGAAGDATCRHLCGNHCYNVGVSHSGFFYCNDCTRRNGHSRRFDAFEDLLEHLEDHHSVDCISVSPVPDPSDPVYYKCECGFGSCTGASEQCLLNHIKGSHTLDVNASSTGHFFCNECDGRGWGGRRLDSLEDLLSHLESRHGFDSATVL